jgi:hypothetical protein
VPLVETESLLELTSPPSVADPDVDPSSTALVPLVADPSPALLDALVDVASVGCPVLASSETFDPPVPASSKPDVLGSSPPHP